MPFQSIRDMFSKLFSGKPKEDEVPSIAAAPYPAAPSKPREVESYGPAAEAPPPAPLRAEVIATELVEEKMAAAPTATAVVVGLDEIGHDAPKPHDAIEVAEVKSAEESDGGRVTAPVVKPAAAVAAAATKSSSAVSRQTKSSDREPFMSSASSGENPASRRDFAPSSSSAAADDSLLDLGEAKTNSVAPTISDNEDVILDLGDEPAFAPAAWESARVQPAAARVVAPPSSAAAAASSSQQTGAGAITLDQLSPEVIDAIAKRVVEHLSTKVIEEIAWDVVPQLAELMIKRQLDQTNARRS